MAIKTFSFADIEALRKKKKVKKKSLCSAIGRHCTMYSAWLQNKSRISLEDANKCVEFLQSIK